MRIRKTKRMIGQQYRYDNDKKHNDKKVFYGHSVQIGFFFFFFFQGFLPFPSDVTNMI